ncbi:MAG TPA: SRPBCC family protein [Candidatus Micrarchaeia archaeon]|nr:SRPBCC family protein [Candidatus Micrarchaeia archaeon]
MIAEASIVVRASVERLRAVVLDPEAYAAADTKVSRIEIESRTADGLVARIHGRFGPVRSMLRARYTVHDRRIDLDMLQGRLRGFHAEFRFEPEGDGVRLTHREAYDFGYGPATPLVQWALQGWATRSVEAEVRALKVAAEGSR